MEVSVGRPTCHSLSDLYSRSAAAAASISVSIPLSEFLVVDPVHLSSGSPAHCGQAGGNIYIYIYYLSKT